ncbi:hypothetical protein ACFX19_041828 [Malus domestica]
MELRRSVRQNATMRGAASSPRVSTMGTTVVATSVATRGEVHGAFVTPTMGTTAVATSVTTRGEVHGTFTTARAVPSKVHGTKTMIQAMPSKFTWTQAQASHSHALRIKQHAPVIQLALVAQPAPTIQPAPVIQPAPAAHPALMVSQAAQVGPRQSQPSGPIIEAEAFSPHFFGRFDIPQLKSRTWNQPPFYCSRRCIPSKFFQSEWRTKLIPTSHRIDERHCTTNYLGEPTFATH